MTVKKLIDILNKNVKKCDQKNANIEIWLGEDMYEIKSLGGFGFSPDITIDIKPATDAMVVTPFVPKKEHQARVNKIKKQIDKDLKSIK